MNTKKIITFLFITLAISWINWFIGLDYISEGLNQETVTVFLRFFFIGVYGPTISVILTTLVFNGPKELLKLIKKIFLWRVPLKYYLYIIFLPIVFVATGLILYKQFIGEIGEFNGMAFLGIPTVLWAGLFAGPLGEELGWRGFLLPELQKRFSNLESALVLGIIWFCWHIPLFWAPFGTLVSGAPITVSTVATYLIMLICLSVIMTWFSIRSNGSVLLAILFHLSVNAGIALLFFPAVGGDFVRVHLLSAVGMAFFTIALIARKKVK
nr:type II CAAX endopeptidase family protein [uncultured Undibacterium sp.]